MVVRIKLLESTFQTVLPSTRGKKIVFAKKRRWS